MQARKGLLCPFKTPEIASCRTAPFAHPNPRTLLRVGHHCLRDRLPDSVDLRRLPAALDTHANVHRREAVTAQEQDGLDGLHAHDGRLDEVQGLPVEADKALALLGECNGYGIALAAKGWRRGGRGGGR